ncbi:MAG TPA: four helix bundle protein [Patescibacteria group bacterium]|nr:four helix bundle protein [Patescibacteria group bacterium]
MANDIPLVHKITELYKLMYQANIQINKRDRFGISLKTEMICLELLESSIIASYLPKNEKSTVLKILRVKIELLKQLIRLTKELNVINDKKYIDWSGRLIEISKMNNSWLNWATKESPS